MDRQSRPNLGFLISMILHGAAIAMIVLGPSFIPGMGGKGDSRSTTVEFAVNTPTPTSPVTATPKLDVAPQPKVETPLPEKATDTLSDIKTVQQPVAKEVKKMHKAVVAKTPIAKAKPAPVIAKELPNKVDEQKESPVEDMPAAEPVPVKETVAAEAVDTEKVTAAPEQKEEVKQVQDEPLPAPVVAKTEEKAPAKEVVAAPPAQAIKTETAKGDSQDIANSPTAAPIARSATPEVTQSFLDLKQMSGNPKPTYPTEARRQQIQGAGQMVYFVTKDGKVSQLKLTKSTGSSQLDQAALDTFSKYRFVPGQEGYTVHNFEFSLKGPAQSESGRLRTTMAH